MTRSVFNVGRALLVISAAGLFFGCAETKRLKTENAQLKKQVASLSDALAAQEAGDGQSAARASALEQELARTRSALDAKDKEFEDLQRRLSAEGFDVSVTSGSVVVTMPAKVLYASGSAVITSSGKEKLGRLAKELATEFEGFLIEIQGHTDADPILKTKDRYKSNWELSYDRAQTVAYYLMNECKMAPTRVHVAAFGQHRPVDPGTSSSAKANNRRVEIVVIKPSK